MPEPALSTGWAQEDWGEEAVAAAASGGGGVSFCPQFGHLSAAQETQTT